VKPDERVKNLTINSNTHNTTATTIIMPELATIGVAVVINLKLHIMKIGTLQVLVRKV